MRACVATVRSHAVALLLATLALVRADADLEDHSAAWAASGLDGSALAAGFENALPPALYAAVVAEVPAAGREQATEGYQDKFGKKSTWWMPLFESGSSVRRAAPRSAIEAAVHELFDLDFRGKSTPVVGAEWWVQEQGPAEGIGYHYDKDETYASQHMTMRFPEVSTITYLTEAGAPTIILDQTTPDGNVEIPELPSRGVLVHPQPNKHVAFRGNLHHGVSGELSLSPPGSGRRRTLLINWWRRPPMPPNCVPFEEGRWRKLGMLRSPTNASALRARPAVGGDGASASTPLRWEPMAMGVAAADANGGSSAAAAGGTGGGSAASAALARSSKRISIELPPTNLYYLDFAPPATQTAAGNYVVEWPAGAAMGPIARLDLNHHSCVKVLFRERKPKLFLVMGNGGHSDWRGTLPKWLPELFATHGESFRLVLANPSDTADFLRVFGLAAKDAPTAVIHDTVAEANGGEAKYRLKGQMSKAALLRFVASFLAGELHKEEQASRDEL